MISSDTTTKAYEDLLRSASNPRQRVSLERIHKACDYLEGQGLRITPSSIERYCIDHDWEGPKAQSIRNSKTLNKYVSLRGSGQTITHSNKIPKSRPLIADQTLRAYVQLLEEELDQARAAKNRIEAGIRNLPGIPVDELIRVGFGGSPTIQNAPPPVKLSPIVIEAIQILLSDGRLADCGLQLYKDRLRQSLTGNVLLEKKHIEALRRLMTDPSDISDA